jgi:hypothetical protein
MSIYVVTGKLGNGKTLLAVSRIREALKAGRRVATNLDLRLEYMLEPHTGKPRLSDGVAKWYQPLSCIRLPDKPTVDDLESIGKGCDSVDEKNYGLLVLDELGSWLNARDWADKGRQRVIDWLIHSRKKRWDVIFIVQHSNMLDKQVREALLEYLVTCKRLDKVRVPFFGRIGQLLSLGAWDGRVGRLHLGVVTYAAGSLDQRNAIVIDRWLYRGNSLFQAYDTEQVFSSSYAHGPYSYLPPWHTTGRYLGPTKWQQRIKALRVWLGLEIQPRRKLAPPPRLKPLMRLPADVRWMAARRLVLNGRL